jgi:hypothetical protein
MAYDGRPLTGDERAKFLAKVAADNERRMASREWRGGGEDPLDFEDPADIYSDAMIVIEEKLTEAKAEVERLEIVRRALLDGARGSDAD